MEKAKKTLQDYFQTLLDRVPGLRTIVVSDRDGVNMAQVSKSEGPQVDSFASVFSVAADQSAKLGMGKTGVITSFFTDRVVVHVNHLPLIVSFVGEPNVNIGLIYELIPELKASLDPLQNSVVTMTDE